jgi:hypothetical protein
MPKDAIGRALYECLCLSLRSLWRRMPSCAKCGDLNILLHRELRRVSGRGQTPGSVSMFDAQ